MTGTGLQQTTTPMNSGIPATQARLRNSCDACNTAKVKCSKERPCCRRCQRKEQFCVYSVSLRCAKRPTDSRPAPTARRNTASTISTQPTQSQNHGITLNAGLEGGLDATIDSTSSISNSLYDFDSLSALSEMNFDLHNLDDYFSTDNYLPPTNFHAYASTPTSTTSAAHRSIVSQPSRSTAPLCGCQQHILSKLSELSLSANPGAPIPFDRALSENRVS